MSWVYRRPFDYRSRPTPFFLLRYAAAVARGSSDLSLTATGSITGIGALSGSASLSMGASASLTGESALIGSTAILIDADGSIAGTGALVGTISLQFTLAATGTLQQAYSPLMYRPTKRWASREVDYRAYTDRVVIFPLKVATDIEGTASLTLDASAVLVGQAAISGACSLTFGASATLLGAGHLAGASAMAFDLSATLGGTTSGGIAGAASLQFDCAAALLGIGELIGNASLSLGASGNLTDRDAPAIEAPTNIGGDDVPRDRGHRGWDQKRSTIKRSEELRLEQSIRSIYRELTESPEMAPRAAAALARLAAPGTSEDELPRIAARRALAMDSVGVEVETSLRMLREELSELEQFHEATMIAALLERLL